MNNQRPRRPFVALLFAVSLACTVSLAFAGDASAADAPRPNLVVILADDLGYSDLGCYGAEIETPVLDQLARGGLRFTQFYNTARCWPTRSSLLTGYYPQAIRRDQVPGLKSGGQGVRPEWARLLPELLQGGGYRSYHSGKWHVDGKALPGGFARSYMLNDHGRYFSARNHWLDDKPLPAAERDSGYYATTAIADRTIEWLKEHATSHSDKRFFQFVAFTAPHFPLHALPEDIAKYRERYRQGWGVARQQRYERQRKELERVAELSAPELEVGPPYHFPKDLEKLGPGEVNRPLPWEQLTDEQRAFQADKMAIHAAMVDRMDREIGRIVAQLREMKALDDTLILFLSDNGASAEMMVRDDGHDPRASPGSAGSHLCLGPGWSTVSNTPFRRHKTWVHEGGISSPLIAHWPRGIKARGELRHTPGHVVDVVPTLLELAGVNRLTQWQGKPVPPLQGVSLTPALAADVPVARESIWWSHEGNRALRAGDWKIVAAGAESPWSLYNLAEDRAEARDLAGERPEKVRELEALWTRLRDQHFALAK